MARGGSLRLDRVWVPAAAAVLLALLFGAALLLRADGDISLLVHAAPPWTSEDAPSSLTLQDIDRGFDGQFYYRSAAAPLSTKEWADGISFDLPALRSSRVGYSVLARVASAGDLDLLPWGLLAVNVAAMGALGWIGGGFARSFGRHAAWGVALPLWPGFAYTLSMDLSELVASALALGGLLALTRRRWTAAALLLSGGVLTRETVVLYVAAVFVAGLVATGSGSRQALGRFRVDPRIWVAVAAATVFVGWQVFIWCRFGGFAMGSSGGSNNFGLPLFGLTSELLRSLPPSSGEELYRVVCVGGLVSLLGLAASVWRRSVAPMEVRLGWVAATVLVLLLNAYQWSGATAFLRGATEAGLLSALVILAGSRRAVCFALVGGLAILWMASAGAQLAKLA